MLETRLLYVTERAKVSIVWNAHLVQMSLQEELNPVESNDLDNIFAISSVDLLAGVQQREEKLETSIPENNHFDSLFIFCKSQNLMDNVDALKNREFWLIKARCLGRSLTRQRELIKENRIRLYLCRHLLVTRCHRSPVWVRLFARSLTTCSTLQPWRGWNRERQWHAGLCKEDRGWRSRGSRSSRWNSRLSWGCSVAFRRVKTRAEVARWWHLFGSLIKFRKENL